MEEKDALDVLKYAFDNGVTFFDTSDFYGTKHSNEELLGVVCNSTLTLTVCMVSNSSI